jgi:hypothetical protein
MDDQPPISCYFTIDYLEARVNIENGWKPGLGTTSADTVRAAIIEVEFLNCLLEDTRVRACFHALYEKTNMALLLGLSLPDDLQSYTDHIHRHRGTITAGIQQLMVDALHLPANWELCHLLECAFFNHITGLHPGDRVATGYVLSYSSRRAPEVCLTFKTLPGEGAWEALGRFEQLAHV